MILIAAALLSTQVGLAGVWEAKRRFGPEARGAIVLRHEGTAWSADFIGRTIAVREEHGVLTFAIPEGSLRANIEKDGIHGYWRQPPKTSDGNVYATPVHLRPDGATRWRGEVVPDEDVFTFYLVIGGKGEAFLRNPERNAAINWKVNRFARDGKAVKISRDDEAIAEGTYDEETDTISLMIAGRGGTYDFRRAADTSGFYSRGRVPERYAYHPPIALDDGWPVGTLEGAHIDRAKIEKFVQELIEAPVSDIHANDIHAILVARHGRLVLEEYFHGVDRYTPADVRSASKSLTSILFGAAHLAPSLPVYETLKSFGIEPDDPRKRAMKTEHLLTMASGFYCDDGDDKAPGNENTMNEQTAEPDLYKYTLRVPMADDPGERSVYCSANPNLAGAIIAQAAGAPLADLFDRLVARPLQFGRYSLGLQRTGEPYMGGGWHIAPRDFMKIGQLVLDEGVWRGKRIVSRDYMARATAPLMALGKRKYGYLFWIDDRPHKGRTVRTVMALGNGGNIVFAFPELDTVITFMGGNYNDLTYIFSKTNPFVPETILEMVEER